MAPGYSGNETLLPPSTGSAGCWISSSSALIAFLFLSSLSPSGSQWPETGAPPPPSPPVVLAGIVPVPEGASESDRAGGIAGGGGTAAPFRLKR